MTTPDWLDDLVPLLDPTSLPPVLTLAEATSLGYPFPVVRRRVRRGVWLRLAPGVYCTTPPATRIHHLAAATKHGGPRSVVSGAAALRAYGFRTAPEPTSELLLVPADAGARSVGRIVVRRTQRLPDPVAVPGARLAPADRAAIDHARTLARLDDVRAVLGEAVQRNFCSAAELAEEVRLGARNGSALVRVAAGEVAAGSRSAPEARAAALLRAAGLGPFVQNGAIVVGGRTYYPDFRWPRLRAILEIDSYEHHFRRADWQATLQRHLALEAAGYSVVHVPPSSLNDARAFVGQIRSWLAVRRRQIG